METFLGAKIEIQATFVAAGRDRKKGGSWELESSETALPSRIKVRVPGDLEQEADLARRQYHRFGRYAEVLEEIRAYLQEQPLEKLTCSDCATAQGCPRISTLLRLPGIRTTTWLTTGSWPDFATAETSQMGQR